MAKCKIKINTTIDNNTSIQLFNGELKNNCDGGVLSYNEKDSLVEIKFDNNIIEIFREGDYGQSMRFIKGDIAQGNLSVNGNTANFNIITNEMQIYFCENILKLKIDYDIDFISEKQNYIVEISAH